MRGRTPGCRDRRATAWTLPSLTRHLAAIARYNKVKRLIENETGNRLGVTSMVAYLEDDRWKRSFWMPFVPLDKLSDH